MAIARYHEVGIWQIGGSKRIEQEWNLLVGAHLPEAQEHDRRRRDPELRADVLRRSTRRIHAIERSVGHDLDLQWPAELLAEAIGHCPIVGQDRGAGSG